MRRLHGKIIATYLSFLALSACSFNSHDDWSHGMECSVCMEVRAVSDEKSGVAINAREAAYRRGDLFENSAVLMKDWSSCLLYTSAAADDS